MNPITLNTMRRYAEKQLCEMECNIIEEEINTPLPNLSETRTIESTYPAVVPDTTNAKVQSIAKEPTSEDPIERRSTDSIIDVAEEGRPNSTNRYDAKSKPTKDHTDKPTAIKPNIDMLNNLTVMYEKYKDMKLDQRQRPKRYTMS